MENKASEISGKLKQKATASTPRNREESPRGESSMDSRDANAHVPENPEFDALVARKAFELYQRRGSEGGRDVEDWLEAERLIEQETESSKR
jgi:hypothetical protein